jgi:AraC family transcriptional regulator
MEPSLVSSTSIDLLSILPFRLVNEPHASTPDGILPFGAQMVQPDCLVQVPEQKEDHILAVQLRDVASVRGVGHRPFHVVSKPGDVYIVPRAEPAAYHYTWPGARDIFMILLAPWVLAKVALQALECDPDRVDLVVRNAHADPLLHALGQAFVSELQSGGIAGSLYLETLTQTLAVHLLRQHSTLAPRALPSAHDHVTGRLQRVLEFIDAHLHQSLTLAEIAAEVHLSSYHLARSFKQVLGVSLHQYIIEQRIERGRQLLESGNYTIGEVAKLVGFVDHSHFTQHFKRKYGVPPSAMLKKRKSILV